jgi:hypothetical protein
MLPGAPRPPDENMGGMTVQYDDDTARRAERQIGRARASAYVTGRPDEYTWTFFPGPDDHLPRREAGALFFQDLARSRGRGESVMLEFRADG